MLVTSNVPLIVWRDKEGYAYFSVGLILALVSLLTERVRRVTTVGFWVWLAAGLMSVGMFFVPAALALSWPFLRDTPAKQT